ncbi:hypothetical protein B0H16DRAFT_1469559 [Mycena metata]|uniref:Uncharacterized protein n=1 Tax=Mycena metata TaxID=1033252 RepID=A0AAD7HZL1_9AGAR|nr:hypothetical protein B0H16DRAFT_1478334 [Mycena metata]KAJ7730589.1 hypothetical protein B0H16DRAFT_1469559 [Mycena metata]
MSSERQRLAVAALDLETSKMYSLAQLQRRQQHLVTSRTPQNSEPTKVQLELAAVLDRINHHIHLNALEIETIHGINLGFLQNANQMTLWPVQQPHTLSSIAHPGKTELNPAEYVYNPFPKVQAAQSFITEHNASSGVSNLVSEALVQTGLAPDVVSDSALSTDKLQVSHRSPFGVEDIDDAVRSLTQQLLGIRRDKDIRSISVNNFTTREESARYARGDSGAAEPSLEPFRPCWNDLGGTWNRTLEGLFVQRFKLRYPRLNAEEFYVRRRFRLRLVAMKRCLPKDS